MQTTVYLVRNAETAWSTERRLAGRRELGLSPAGQATAQRLVRLFEGISLEELLVSPLPRAIETSRPLADARSLDVARDPRLLDWNVGEWEGRLFTDIAADPRYVAGAQMPFDQIVLPGGEKLVDVRARMLSSIEQALADNQLGSHIVVVSHAGPLRVLLGHYLSKMPWEESLRLSPGAVTVLGFSSLSAPPTLLGLNLTTPILDTPVAAR